ncbi:MAG: sulfate transporter, periplasmic sulfate-binding protein [Marmoricola sp.]|nr:sulfate transporter, periplasmic sulfate-binding protein [Marmoricola sp.]
MSMQGTRARGTRRRWVAVAAALTATIVGVTGCGSTSAGGKKDTVNLVGFSILQQPNTNLIKDFQATAAGKGVTFTTSYGASGDQARAVIAGQPADYVHLSLATDVAKLVDAGLVAKDWDSGSTQGIASQTVVVLTVRKGNPKHITGWDDLVKPGIKIVTPNPGSSGSARWNILAAWGHVIASGGTEADATAYLKKFFANTAALPSSGREATTAFESGVGDVLVSYETEAIAARASGAPLDYIVPSDTLLIQNPAAVTVKSSAAAKAFLAFVLSKAGQLDYAKAGFRPLVDVGTYTTPGANDPSNPYPTPTTLLTIDKNFGGWTAAAKKFFDVKDGIVTKIQAETGKQ